MSSLRCRLFVLLACAVAACTPDHGAGYLEHCGSLFAARILEMQVGSAHFPHDCDSPLLDNVGLLKPGGDVVCASGESPNACRQRRYDHPPSLTNKLAAGCANGAGSAGCLRGSWLPKCADGTDTSCAEAEAVCQDGTRPLIYAEAATTGPSNIWLFELGGEGGPCANAQCWINYRYESLAHGTAFQEAMSTLHPDLDTQASEDGTGIMAGVPQAANPFAGYNRVKFKRCSDAASDAQEMVTVANGVPQRLAAEYPTALLMTKTSTAPVWHRGFNIWMSMFHALAPRAGLDLDGDGTADLPSLSNATTVVIAGSSDASVWVMLSADRFAKELRAIAGPDVDVRLLIDGHFEPGLDNEGRYQTGAPSPFNMFTNSYAATGLCQLPDNGDGVANEACSSQSYAPGGKYRAPLDERGVKRDESCEAFHGVGAYQCTDRLHTLIHHIGIPSFTLSDQEDPTISAGGATYADDPSYSWDAPETWRMRVLAQARDILAHRTTAREEGAGTAGHLALVLSKARRNGRPWSDAVHVRFDSDAKMAQGMTRCTAGGDVVNTVSFASMIGAWIADMSARTYVVEDATAWDGTSDYWVTGNVCRAPE